MVDKPGGVQPGVDRWGVLSSKLRRPALRSNALPRSALVARLARSQATLVVVLAGAGYGKTTLANEWLASDARPSGWATLDGGDDDPVVLLRHLVRVLHEIEPLPGVEATLAAASIAVDREVLPAVSAAFDRGRAPFLLVLDDVHHLTSAGSLRVLDRLIDLVPDGSCVVLLGRAVPHLGFSRRVLAGGVEFVGQDDLRFTPEEARAVLVDGLPMLDEASAEELVERTEGWPAGVHLAVLALHDRPDASASVRELATTGPHLVSYFHHELLAHLDASTRSFLVRTAVLDRFTAPLCDVVLDRTDSASVLARLASSGNQFLVRLDGQPPIFRYHHLFAELLLAELRLTAPGDEPVLRRRAARCLAEHGRSEAAVMQALAAADSELAAEIIHDDMASVISRGHIATLERWLGAFPEQDVHRLALLAVAQGWLEFTRGRREGLANCVEVAERLIDEENLRLGGNPGGGQRPDAAVALAALCMTSGIGGVRQAAKNARIVREAGPTASPFWTLSWLMEASALFAMGDLPDAVGPFAAAVAATEGSSASHSAALAQLALVTSQAGDAERAWEHIRAAVEEVEAAGLTQFPLTMNVWSVNALLAARRGWIAESAASSARVERALRGFQATPRGAILARLLLADAAWERGDPRAARQQLVMARALIRLEPEATAFMVWAERVEARIARSYEAPRPTFTAAEGRVLTMLASHYSLEEIGIQLFVSRNTVKTHTISIYRKLGVASRSAAVARARELGLLDH